jgi:hypothetical protein
MLSNEAFEDLVEGLIFQQKTKEEIYKKTKASKEKIAETRRNLRDRWLDESSHNYSLQSNLAHTEAQINYLIKTAFQSFLISQKRKVVVYKNDVTNQKGLTIETHRIEPTNAGDVSFLRLIHELIKQRITLNKLDKMEYNGNDLDPESLMEFYEWKALARKSQELGIKQEFTPELLEEFFTWQNQQDNEQ